MKNRLAPKVVIAADATDLRDQEYKPALLPLRPGALAPAYLAKSCGSDGYRYHVRDQGQEDSCSGHALAHLIDIHRYGVTTKKPGPGGCVIAQDRPGVSAHMLYEMALRQETGGDGKVTSLRSVLKGFYHHGVCDASLWPQSDAKGLDIERAKAAKGITLGAYYRVSPVLNDYHAALNEAECILVSAELHEGWASKDLNLKTRDPAHHARRGIIPEGRTVPNSGHAFLIVGYNQDGFLVLNSWGPDWGHYEDRPGIALWPYSDWASRVLDAWVLRLGVPAPEAFQHSIGRQGILFDGMPINTSSSACHQLLGHYAHLDDGSHVPSGSYESSRASVTMTAENFAKRPDASGRKPVLLSVTGSLLGMKQAFGVEVRRRQAVEQLGLYPYAVFWCNDFIESSISVLVHLFKDAVKKVGAHSPTLDTVIEKTTAGIGRAFWRDVRNSAHKAGTHGSGLPNATDGDAAHLFDSFAAQDSVDLHLLVDGAGAILLEQYLLSLHDPDQSEAERARRTKLRETFYARVASLNLIAPTLEYEPFRKAYGPLIEALAQKGQDRACLWVPSYPLESKLRVAEYTHSILDLVLFGFEGKPRDTAYIGMSRARSNIDDKIQHAQTGMPGLSLRTIDQPDADRQRFAQTDVNLNVDCQKSILAAIHAFQKEDFRRRTAHGHD